MVWLTLTNLLVFAGFYLWYATSKRARVAETFGFESWALRQKRQARVLAGSLLLGGLFTAAASYGLGAGIFLYLVVLMTLGSLIILLYPLNLLNRVTVPAIFLFSFLIETLV